MRQHKTLYLPLISLLVIIIVAGLNRGAYTDSIDYLYYDFLQRLSAPGPSDDVVIIGIDEVSLSAIGRWPWSRAVHAELIEKLTLAEVSGVVFDVVFAEPDLDDEAGDAAFVSAMKQNSRVVLPVMLDESTIGGQIVEVVPYGEFMTAAKIGHVHVELDFDGVVRNFYRTEGLGNDSWNHIAIQAFKLSQGDAKGENQIVPVTIADANIDTDSKTVNRPGFGIVRTGKQSIRFATAAGGYGTVSYIDVLNGSLPLEKLKGKLVFVGATAAAMGDRFATPMSQDGLQLSGVELNATIYENVRDNNFILHVNPTAILILQLLIALVPILVMPRLSPSRALMVMGALGLTTAGATALAFSYLSIWMPVAPALIGMMSLYIMFTWRRLVIAITFLEEESTRLVTTIAQYRGAQATAADELDAYSRAIGWKPIVSHLVDVEGSYSSDTELFGKTITLVQQSNQDVQELQALFESTLLLLSDGVMVWDQFGRPLFINKRFSEVHGSMSSDALYNFSALSLLQEFRLLKEDLQWHDVIRECQMNRKSFEMEIKNSNDQEFLVRLEKQNLSNSTGDFLIACITEITQLKDAQRERSETIHFLSHDLRSPMVSILALIERAKIGSYKEENLQPLLEKVAVYANKNLEFAEKFLQLARLEGQDSVEFEECDFGAIIDNAIEHLYWLALKKNITIEFDSGEESDAECYFDMVPDLVERVIVNLLENSIKYCPKHSSIDVSLRHSSSQANCVISDNGPGIPPELLPSIFSRFTRAKHQQDMSGVGLGLRFTAVAMEKHSGTVVASNNSSGGAQFELTFPIRNKDYKSVIKNHTSGRAESQE